MASGGRLNIARGLADDAAPPSTPSNFGAVESKAMSVTLRWVAPGDDNNLGRASRYELRMADRPIVDRSANKGEIPFDDAIPVSTSDPLTSGSIETIKVPVPLNKAPKTWYFALKAIDKVGNKSGMAATKATTKPPVVVFSDEAEGEENWTPQAPWGKEVMSGRGNVWSDSPGGAYSDNANVALTSKPIKLEGVAEPVLFFTEKHDLESTLD